MRAWWLRLTRLLRYARAERDIDDELRSHVEMEAESLQRGGLDAAEARRRARLVFGGEDRWRESVRSTRGTAWLEDAVRDTKFALRELRRTPGFTAAAVGTLALGVGATVAVFSVVDQVVFDPLPYPEPEQLVALWHTNPAQAITKGTTSWPNFRDWREAASSFERLATVVPARRTLTGAGDPVEVRAVSVSRGFFELIGVPPVLGRAFRDEEVEGDSARVAILSHRLFTARFGADPAVVGRTIELDGAPLEIVGVAAAGAAYPRDADLWIPQAFGVGRQWRDPRNRLWISVVGRLAEGTEPSRAQSDLDAVAARLARRYPDTNTGVGVAVEPLHDTIVGDLRTPFRVLLGAVGVVLLLAVVNVGNLLLARGTARRREWAARLALGAGRARVVRQALTQSAVLGVLGGLLGAGLAVSGVVALVGWAPGDLPRIETVHVNAGVLALALAVGLLSSLVFGVAPALRATRLDPGASLRPGLRGVGEPDSSRLRAVFVGAQFAFAFALLVGAGLLLRSFANLRAVDAGFDSEGVLSVHLSLPPDRYESPEAMRAFQATLLEQVRRLPGVEGVGTITSLFLGERPAAGTITVEGGGDLDPGTPGSGGAEVPVVTDAVSPELFETLDMRLLAGRGFDERDGPDDAPAVVVNRAFERIYTRGRSAIGRRFTWGEPYGEATVWFTIVGVVADARRSRLDRPARPAVFTSSIQRPRRDFDVMVRTTGDPLALTPGLAAVIAELDAGLPLTRVQTLESALGATLAERRFVAWLLGIFAAAALSLAAIGVFGVMAWMVSRRTREIGIRAALGAGRGRILREVLRDGLAYAGAGLAVGIAASLLLTGLLRSQLVGVSATDPVTFAGAAALLVLVAVAGTLAPARRATRVDATVALREE